MKKLAITTAIILGLAVCSFGQRQGGGLFQFGAQSEETNNGFGQTRGGDDGGLISLPTEHGQTTDEDAPLGSGIAVLLGLGAAYMVAKKRKED